ncbi:MAG: MFS transporter, partial [Actinobacteria bacterium]
MKAAPLRRGPLGDEQIHERRWWTLAVLVLSLIIIFVGNSSLNVAIPVLSRELHATTSQLQWVVAVYSLVFAGLLFTTGALGDRYGRKGALQLGLLLYLVAAGLATLSSAMWQLIVCRAVMGAAAALIMPSTLSILINVFPSEERPRAIAIWASFLGAAGAIGPTVSGWLLVHFWYGSVFFVNVPFILLALVSGWFLVPRSRDPEEARFDPGGALLSIVGIVALVYGLIEAPAKGWGSASTLLRLHGGDRRARCLRRLGEARRRAHARHEVLPQPGVQHRFGGHDPRLPRDVRRDVHAHAVPPAGAGLQRPRGSHPFPADDAGHAAGGAPHAPALRTLRRPSGGRRRDDPDRHRVRALRQPSADDRLRLHPGFHLPVRHRPRPDHVTDDGLDHVGSSASSGRGRLGHQRRHARAGRRPRR